MSAATEGKTCTKCGVFKGPEEFYINRKLKNGGSILASKCKACKRKINSARKRKGDGEYRTLEEISAAAPKCDYCGMRLSGNQHAEDCQRPKPRKQTDWETRCGEALRKLNQEIDPWMKRCEAARAGMRRRPKAGQRFNMTLEKMHSIARMELDRLTITHQPSDSWDAKISNALSSLRKRARRRREKACMD